jgi:CheY-like chemotaxis protein
VPRVLVVDDEADVRTMISIVLRIHRFEIVEAASGSAALKAFEDLSLTSRSSISSWMASTVSTSSP